MAISSSELAPLFKACPVARGEDEKVVDVDSTANTARSCPPLATGPMATLWTLAGGGMGAIWVLTATPAYFPPLRL